MSAGGIHWTTVPAEKVLQLRYGDDDVVQSVLVSFQGYPQWTPCTKKFFRVNVTPVCEFLTQCNQQEYLAFCWAWERHWDADSLHESLKAHWQLKEQHVTRRSLKR